MNLFYHILTLTLFSIKDTVPKITHTGKDKCGAKLLDDFELIPDSAFTASSFYNHSNERDKKIDFSPKAARELFDIENQDCAWCPESKVSTNLEEYLEIDLGRLTVVNYVQTRGRFAQGAGKEYSPYYKIAYKREAYDIWRNYKAIDKSTGFKDLFKGPNDAFLDVYETLNPPIITRWIRIYPFSYETIRVCLKLQLFGCTCENHVLEYRIHQGSMSKIPQVKVSGSFENILGIFQDTTFDGSKDQSLLNGGIGRLTDNKTGGDILKSQEEASKYVGWNRNEIGTSQSDQITLLFRFDSIRNFTSMRLYSYENRTLKIAQPKAFEAKFSLDGERFSDQDFSSANFPEAKSEIIHSDGENSEGPWVEFSLKNRIGQFIKLTLFFEEDWLLISEIVFHSDKVNAPPSFRVSPPSVFQSTPKEKAILSEHPQSHIDQSTSTDAVLMLTILLCLLLGIIFAISIFWLLMRRKRIKRKKDLKKQGLAIYSQNPYKSLNMSTPNQSGLYHFPNTYYKSGTLQLMPTETRPFKQDPCMFQTNFSTQNCIPLQKQGIPGEGSIYTSIPGSDNESSLGTDYMVSNGGASSHPYVQTVPMNGSVSEYMVTQPQIIGNPLVELLDNQTFINRNSNSALHSYEPDVVAMTTNPHHANTIDNIQSFPVIAPYQSLDHKSIVDIAMFSLPNSYHNSPMR